MTHPLADSREPGLTLAELLKVIRACDPLIGRRNRARLLCNSACVEGECYRIGPDADPLDHRPLFVLHTRTARFLKDTGHLDSDQELADWLECCFESGALKLRAARTVTRGIDLTST